MGKIFTSTLYSRSLHIDWNYDLYLTRKTTQNSKYKLLILLHGLYGNHTNFIDSNRIDVKSILDKLLLKNDQALIVAIVDGFNSFYIDSPTGMKMESAIMTDLIPYLRKKFPIKDQIDIGGISMGGYGAARLALKYPTQFKKVFLISPAVWQIMDIPRPIYNSIHAFAMHDNNWSINCYRQLFPTEYVNEQSKQINFRIEISQQDKIVPINSVELFVKELNKNKNKVEFIIDPIGDHNWSYWQQVIVDSLKWIIE